MVQGVYVNVQQNGNATPGWAKGPNAQKEQTKWLQAQQKLKIDKETGAGCCGYIFSFIIITASLVIGAMSLNYVRNGLRTTLEEQSIDVTVGGVNIAFDLDFILAQAPNDTGIAMVDEKDKDALLNTVVYYSQSVVIPFLATAFFSLVLFLSYCCKSRCFVILSRIFLIILIILFFFISGIGFGGYATADKLYEHLDANVNLNSMISGTLSDSVNSTTESSSRSISSGDGNANFDIAEIIQNSPIGENAETIDLSEFQAVFEEQGIDIEEIFGDDTVLDLNNLSEDDLANLEEFATQAEAADVDVESIALNHIAETMADTDLWQAILIDSGLIPAAKQMLLMLGIGAVSFFIMLTIQDRIAVKNMKKFKRAKRTPVDDW